MIVRHHKQWMIFALAAGAIALGAWTLTAFGPAPATAADGHNHQAAGHDGHGHGADQGDLDDLFAEEEHKDDHADHRGHDHAEHAGEAHERHDEHGHEARKPDPHAGHGHAERKPDPHAGHGHDDHAGHDHGPGDGACPEHNIPEVEDALCQPQLMAGLQPGQGLKVRLAAPDAAERIGVSASRPVAAAEKGAALPGQAVFNRNRLARLSSLVPGVVRKVHAELGAQVKEGQVLAEIASPEIASLRASLQEAQTRAALAEDVYLREKDLLARGITSRQEFQQAEAERAQARSAVAQARQQLIDYGIAPADLLAAKGSSLPLRAPFAGTVVERSAVPGEAVESGSTLFSVADLDTLWVELSVPESRLLEVRPGVGVSATFSALPGRAFPGTIFWVAPALDERTRMLKALAELPNDNGLLRSGLFAEVRLENDLQTDAFAVPADALQSIDGDPFVFVALEPDLFELRRVDAGRRDNGTVIIARGLAAHDRVVTGQGFALKSEILKSRLGASCADH